MMIYAVMKTGGKEHRVAPGDVVRVEKLSAAPGATVEIDEVYLIAIGQDVTVGSPTVANARVVAEVVEEGHGEKIVSFKKKRRSHYQMTMEDVQSYTVLRIREIAVGESVYDVAATVAPPRDLAATVTAVPPPPPIAKPERNVREPQAKKPEQPASPPPALVETPPPMAAAADSPIAPKVASEKRVDTQPQDAEPSSDAVHPVHAMESPPSAPSSTETPHTREPRRRSHGIAALVVALLVIAAGLLVWGGGQPHGPVEVATAAAAPQAAPMAQTSVPQPAAKAPPGREAAIRNPAAASAPSAPVQPPE